MITPLMSQLHLNRARARVTRAEQRYIKDMNVTHPYGMISSRVKPKSTKRKHTRKLRKKLDRVRLKTKRNSPGVPPNTCPYIDLVITMIQDLSNAYEDLRTKDIHNPVVDSIEERAKDLMEHIRTNNETLRDNSAYWYDHYKTLLMDS